MIFKHTTTKKWVEKALCHFSDGLNFLCRFALCNHDIEFELAFREKQNYGQFQFGQIDETYLSYDASHAISFIFIWFVDRCGSARFIVRANTHTHTHTHTIAQNDPTAANKYRRERKVL